MKWQMRQERQREVVRMQVAGGPEQSSFLDWNYKPCTLSLGDPTRPYGFKFALVLAAQVSTLSCRRHACLCDTAIERSHGPRTEPLPLFVPPQRVLFSQDATPPSQFPSCLSKTKGPLFSLSWCLAPRPGSFVLAEPLTFLHLGLRGPGYPGIYL